MYSFPAAPVAFNLTDIRMFMRDRSPFVYRSTRGYAVTGWLADCDPGLVHVPPFACAEEGLGRVLVEEARRGPVYVLVVAGRLLAVASGSGLQVSVDVPRGWRRYVNLMAQELCPARRGELWAARGAEVGAGAVDGVEGPEEDTVVPLGVERALPEGVPVLVLQEFLAGARSQVPGARLMESHEPGCPLLVWPAGAGGRGWLGVDVARLVEEAAAGVSWWELGHAAADRIPPGYVGGLQVPGAA